ncbi:MAG: outer membrane beta-barrel protein [Bacteroidales bacterium]|nr:outer membrane beta-barrel protein [Candidatus Liminaster caballi]
MKPLVLFLLLLFLVPCLKAQDKEYLYEIGGGVGTSWAYGDINRSSAVYNPGLAFDLIWRYNLNLRWALALDVSASKLQGDSHDFDNAFPDGQHLTFDSRLWQLAFRPEITFWNYGFGSDYREKHRLAPFLTMGVGFGMARNASLTIPMGLGMKWKMSPRWNAQLTCLFTKVMNDATDRIDDPYGMGTTMPMNTDWIGSLTLSLTFDFKERCVECHNQNSF